MIRRLLGTIGLAAHTAMTVMYAHDLLKARLEKIAEKEVVHNERDYVLVRFARGDYSKPGGVKTMVTDYKFFKTISEFHTTVAVEKNIIPKPRQE